MLLNIEGEVSIPESNEIALLTRRIRFWLILFIIGLALSGLTAFPLEWEVGLLHRWITGPGALAGWIERVYDGLRVSYALYPFLAYGTDWLAFAHLVIAIAFIGPVRDPVRNVWVIEFGMIACVLVFPLALIMGAVRGIPIFWQLIDCSFGVAGLLVLWPVRRMVKRLEESL
ncbi:MAG: hypothetical protein ACYDCO_03270 [Armatimonadota bacterium]